MSGQKPSSQSMTGFGRASGEADGRTLAWEVRSVNGKALDVRLRLPPGWDRIEAPARAAFARRFARGNIQAALNASERQAARFRPTVDEALLHDFAALAQSLVQRFGVAPATADGLLALPGVIRLPDPADSPETKADGEEQALGLLEEALAGLQAARQAEGAALSAILIRQLDAVDALAAHVEADPSRKPDAIRARLAAQVELLIGAQPRLDEGRLAAEAALLAARADVREEIDRLRMHCESGRALLVGGGPAGRRLDFLGQELNREANTLCSKSIAPAVTAAGLELKAVVDQFREQVQNLE